MENENNNDNAKPKANVGGESDNNNESRNGRGNGVNRPQSAQKNRDRSRSKSKSKGRNVIVKKKPLLRNSERKLNRVNSEIADGNGNDGNGNDGNDCKSKSISNSVSSSSSNNSGRQRGIKRKNLEDREDNNNVKRRRKRKHRRSSMAEGYDRTAKSKKSKARIADESKENEDDSDNQDEDVIDNIGENNNGNNDGKRELVDLNMESRSHSHYASCSSVSPTVELENSNSSKSLSDIEALQSSDGGAGAGAGDIDLNLTQNRSRLSTDNNVNISKDSIENKMDDENVFNPNNSNLLSEISPIASKSPRIIGQELKDLKNPDTSMMSENENKCDDNGDNIKNNNDNNNNNNNVSDCFSFTSNLNERSFGNSNNNSFGIGSGAGGYSQNKRANSLPEVSFVFNASVDENVKKSIRQEVSDEIDYEMNCLMESISNDYKNKRNLLTKRATSEPAKHIGAISTPAARAALAAGARPIGEAIARMHNVNSSALNNTPVQVVNGPNGANGVNGVNGSNVAGQLGNSCFTPGGGPSAATQVKQQMKPKVRRVGDQERDVRNPRSKVSGEVKQQVRSPPVARDLIAGGNVNGMDSIVEDINDIDDDLDVDPRFMGDSEELSDISEELNVNMSGKNGTDRCLITKMIVFLLKFILALIWIAVVGGVYFVFLSDEEGKIELDKKAICGGGVEEPNSFYHLVCDDGKVMDMIIENLANINNTWVGRLNMYLQNQNWGLQ